MFMLEPSFLWWYILSIENESPIAVQAPLSSCLHASSMNPLPRWRSGRMAHHLWNHIFLATNPCCLILPRSSAISLQFITYFRDISSAHVRKPAKSRLTTKACATYMAKERNSILLYCIHHLNNSTMLRMWTLLKYCPLYCYMLPSIPSSIYWPKLAPKFHKSVRPTCRSARHVHIPRVICQLSQFVSVIQHRFNSCKCKDLLIILSNSMPAPLP